MKKYNGREWKWWLTLNDHSCKFCRDKGISTPLGMATGLYQSDRGFWKGLYYVWTKHMKQEHPEILNKKN